jgi:hypothetical protein
MYIFTDDGWIGTLRCSDVLYIRSAKCSERERLVYLIEVIVDIVLVEQSVTHAYM